MSTTGTRPTHIVADALNMLTFEFAQFNQVKTELWTTFGIYPTSVQDLVNAVSNGRPDLLIGGIHGAPRLLVISGGTLALDSHSSCLIRSACERLGLSGCKHILTELISDQWVTQLADMKGGIPDIVFHGTTDTYLSSIRNKGLITNGNSNWPGGATGYVHLAATPQIAAVHARETSSKIGGSAIVVACVRPAHLLPDGDVVRAMVNEANVPSQDGCTLAREAGLIAAPAVIPPQNIVQITNPMLRTPYANWPIVP